MRQVTARYASKSFSLVFSTKLAVCSCWASLPSGSSAARTCLLLVLHTVIEVLLSKSASVLACVANKPDMAGQPGPSG